MGKFSSRQLHLFIPRKGTELEGVQAAIEKEWRDREEMEDRVGSNEGKGEINKSDKKNETHL